MWDATGHEPVLFKVYMLCTVGCLKTVSCHSSSPHCNSVTVTINTIKRILG